MQQQQQQGLSSAKQLMMGGLSAAAVQFMDTGCDNCRWMAEELLHGDLDEFTTPNFSG